MSCLKTVFVGACLALSVPVASHARRTPGRGDRSASRIARIERGLLPAVQVTNAPPVKYRLAERMAHYKVPALSMAFVENGRVRGAALTVWPTCNRTPATVNTLFQAASISKPLSALAVLRLVQDGRLALDEDVNLQLKSWKVPENQFTSVEKVTLRRLLTHTRGQRCPAFPAMNPRPRFQPSFRC